MHTMETNPNSHEIQYFEEKDNKIILRWPKPGEWGWMVQQHGKQYFADFKYNSEICELFFGEIINDFLRHQRLNPRSNAWIAEVNGQPMGCIFCNERTQEIAKLRVLYVCPEARGLGLGSKLVNACVEFARKCGYQKMTLYTHSEMEAARRLYDKVGFKLVSSTKHTTFGPEVEAQTLDLDLLK